MATVRQRRPGVWEVRAFTGRDAQGRPTQISRTVRGTKKDANRVAAELTVQPPAQAAGRTLSDILDAWVAQREATWAPASARDQRNRVASLLRDPIAAIPVARLGVADVERWHGRLRRAGAGEGSIRNQHSALRAALAQAVRWGWLPQNVAALARLQQPKRVPRGGMAPEDVRRVIEAATTLDPAAGLALRLAAVGGLRRGELAALRWDDLDGDHLRVDSSVTVVSRSEGTVPVLGDRATKTGNTRVLILDAATANTWEVLRAERAEYGPYLFAVGAIPPNPDRIGWWWHRARQVSGIDQAWRLHDLRHFSATFAISGGHDVRTVAGRLGHSDPAMTLRVYAHAVESADRAVATTLASALDRPAS